MKVGSIVTSSTQGLGILARSFFENGVVDEVLIKRNHKDFNPSWFGSAPLIGCPDSNFLLEPSPREMSEMVNFMSKIDILLLFEVPWFKNLFSIARGMGVRTCVMPMYEVTPPSWVQEADFFLCPSMLDLDVYERMFPKTPKVFLPVPVDLNRLTWRGRTHAKVFIHNAGNGGTAGRNGTKELVDSMKLVESPIELIIRAQNPQILEGLNLEDKRVKVEVGNTPYEDLWKEGDVFIFPEKFNGLSLPIQEAYASGLLLMCGDRFPFNAWLPPEPLIPVADKEEMSIVSVPFHSAIYDPTQIAETIDNWYNKDITEFSLKGRQWGVEHSWENMLQKYKDVLRGVL